MFQLEKKRVNHHAQEVQRADGNFATPMQRADNVPRSRKLKKLDSANTRGAWTTVVEREHYCAQGTIK
jgi:hypothetical protein